MDSSTDLTNEFVENIKQWLLLDDKIREISKSLKELKIMKKSLHEKILLSMEKNEVTELKAGNGKLRYSVSKTKEPLKYETIEEGLLKYFNDDKQKVSEVWDVISNNRKVVERKRVKRTFNRKNNEK